MQFTEYRSTALYMLWKRFWKQYGIDERNVIRKPKFSTWQIDDICAVNWKNENPIEVCANVLFDYVKEIQEDIK